MRVGNLLHMWRASLLAIAAVLVGRVVTVYGIVPISNLFSVKVPFRWQTVMVWGGMRGALALALALSIGEHFPYRNQLLALTFGVVAFTIVVQGITMKPLIRLLGVAKNTDDDFSRARVRQVAIASAISELESMAAKHLISRQVYAQLRRELDARLENVYTMIDSVLDDNLERLSDEFQIARTRISGAEKGAIEQAMHDGWVSAGTASQMIEDADRVPKKEASESRSIPSTGNS